MQNPDVLRQNIQNCITSQDLPQAKKHLQKLCKIEPNDFHAWYSLGSINGQLGKFNDAIKALHKALRIDSSSTEALAILGLAFFSAERYEEAITTYKKLIKIEPDNIDALINISAAYLVLEECEQAILPLQQSLKIKQTSTALANLGKALHGTGNDNDAQAQLEAALNLEPSSLEALMIMGEISHEQHDYEQALKYYEATTQHHPDVAKAWNNKGLVLYDSGQYVEAISSLQFALKLKKNYLSAMLNLGLCYGAQENYNKAEDVFKRCIDIEPRSAKSHLHLGMIQQHQGNSKLALSSLDITLKLEPDNALAYNEKGGIYLNMGCYKESMQQYQKAYELSNKKSSNQHFAMDNLLFGMNYDSENSKEDIYLAHKAWGEQIEKKTTQNIHNHRKHNNKIRIGYFSSDFRTHSVAYFIEPIIAHHEQKEFEIFCYANVLKPDESTKRLQAISNHWRDTRHMTDEVLHQQIIDDEIDILIELMGHTADNRLCVMADKPAPVQITYLGYPNTTGLSSIDYRIVDEITDPQSDGEYNTETLSRLPDCFLCYQPSIEAPSVKNTPAQENNFITFGSFNNLTKITDDVVRTYSEILSVTAGSKLILKNRSFRDSDIRDRFIKLFANNDIDSSRLILLASTPTTAAHLELYNTIDIALDTFPYNGTTTTCEALHMGTPVITYLGDRHAARVSASLLTAIGHKELIAGSEKDYIRLAVELAEDTERLKSYNENLRTDMLKSPLCDAISFTKDLEGLYKKIWENYCSEK